MTGLPVNLLPDLYMAHFWGARAQNWQRVMPEYLQAKVEHNDDLVYMSDNLKNCASHCYRYEFYWVDAPYWDTENRQSNAPPK